ncbi:hypothetical protein AYI68_g232 [Smittium mucronatum]|uniref:Uncharacterized protein n=1 Tax=Smittium mucronatum TaxID=133383 RepID=A0A1R0H8X7_9FUNG|nr:hypothetical protein AYI68_g232 [Smittium mucronatum]
MINIYQRFLIRATEKDYLISDLWDRISNWYDLNVLEELESESESDTAGLNSNIIDTPGLNSFSLDQSGDYNEHFGKGISAPEFNFWKIKAEFCLPWEDFGPQILERASQGVSDENFNDTIIYNYSTSDENEDNLFTNPNSNDFVQKDKSDNLQVEKKMKSKSILPLKKRSRSSRQSTKKPKR